MELSSLAVLKSGGSIAASQISLHLYHQHEKVTSLVLPYSIHVGDLASLDVNINFHTHKITFNYNRQPHHGVEQIF